jgi:hypothetical protein
MSKPTSKTRFPEFYAALFDDTLAKHPEAVITEYAWSAATCDPCPGPVLSPEDIMSLGADVLPGSPTGGFVLTRLHARYTAEQLRDDLVFAAASPIQGGREVYTGTWGDPSSLEHGAAASSFDNFQGRYIIRYPWTGEIACENPRRGIWGGPLGSTDLLGSSSPQLTPATDTAFAPRNTLSLPDAITSTDPTRLAAVDLSALPPAPPAPPLFSNPGFGGPRPIGPRPVLALAVPTIEGVGLDSNAVRRLLAQRKGQFINCYQREVLKDLTLSGRIKLKWTVLANGSVDTTSISVEENLMGNDIVAECLVARVKTMKFPETTDKLPATITYPFKFHVSQ